MIGAMELAIWCDLISGYDLSILSWSDDIIPIPVLWRNPLSIHRIPNIVHWLYWTRIILYTITLFGYRTIWLYNGSNITCFSHSIQSADPRSNEIRRRDDDALYPLITLSRDWFSFFCHLLSDELWYDISTTASWWSKWHFLCWSICNLWQPCSLALDTGF